MNFFHPRISQLISEDGLELAEFPIVYYISALGYELFGFHEWIPRLVSLLIVLFGLWCLFRLLADILQDYFYALILSLLLFTSSVLIFFGITPLPDVAAMPLSVAGLYYFYKYLKSTKINPIVLSFIFYSLAGCIKPTSIISFFTIISVFVLVCTFNFFKPGTFPAPGRRSTVQITLFSIATSAVVLAWWSYVAYYRNLYHTSYFQVNADPIWRASADEIAKVWMQFDLLWMNQYFNKPALILVGLLLIPACFFYTKASKLIFISYFVFLLGCVCYFLLFFTQFYVHDYYIIVILPLFIASLFLFIQAVKNKYRDVFDARWFRGLVLVFFICNAAYAVYKNQDRLHNPFFRQGDHIELAHIEPYLDSIGVRQNDLVIYWGDYAPNVAFYLMNRRGWGQWALNSSLSADNIDKCLAKGARFLIIDQIQCKLDDELQHTIDKYILRKIGDRDSVQIYSVSK